MMALVASHVGLWAVLLLQALIVVALFRKLTELEWLFEKAQLQPARHAPLGEAAPDFVAADARNGAVIRASDIYETGRALLFVATDCRICRGIAAGVSHWPSSPDAKLAMCVVGPASNAQRMVAAIAPSIPIVIDQNDRIAAKYQVAFFPTLVLINETGRIVGYEYPRSEDDLQRRLQTNAQRALERPAIARDTEPVAIN